MHPVENRDGQYLFYDAQGFDIGLHPIVGKLVERQPLVVELAKAGLVAEQRAVTHAGNSGEKLFDGAMEPDRARAVGSEKFDSARLRGGAAPQRDNGRRSLLAGFTFDAPKLIALNFAECRFTVLREEFGDAHAGVLNDPLIEVDVPPPNLAG